MAEIHVGWPDAGGFTLKAGKIAFPIRFGLTHFGAMACKSGQS